MAKVGSALQLYLVQRARFQRVATRLTDVTEWTAKEGRRDLISLTSGTVSERTLRRLGHPYARDPDPKSGQRIRRRIAPTKMKRLTGQRALPPYPINVQEGALRRGIYLTRVGRHAFELGSRARHAKYQFSPWGTRLMIRRGVMGGRKLGLTLPPGRLELMWRARTRVVRDAIRLQYRR